MSGVSWLLKYVHYRFRGPDPMLLRGTFEYFLGKFLAAASNGSHTVAAKRVFGKQNRSLFCGA
jgi:hypothetical protein